MANELITIEQVAKIMKESGDKAAIAEGLAPEEFWKAVAMAWEGLFDDQQRKKNQ